MSHSLMGHGQQQLWITWVKDHERWPTAISGRNTALQQSNLTCDERTNIEWNRSPISASSCSCRSW